MASPFRLRSLVSAGLTVLVVGLLLAVLDLPMVGQALAGARWPPLLLAVVLSLVGRFVLDSLRWRWLLARLDCSISVPVAVRLQAVSMPLRLVTPAKTGLVLCALYLQRHHGMPLARGVSSVLLEKLHNLAFYLGAVALLPLLGAAAPKGMPLALAAGPALAGSVAVVVAVLAVGALVRRVADRPSPAHPLVAKVVSVAAEVLAVFSWLGPRSQLVFFGVTAAILGLEFVEFHLLFTAFGLDLGVLGAGYLMSLVVLVSALPVTIGGVGTREAAALFLLGPVAPAETVAAAMAVLYLVHWLLPSALGAVALPGFFGQLGGLTAARERLHSVMSTEE